MEHLVPAAETQQFLDFPALVAGDPSGILGGIGDQATCQHVALSPRWNSPSIRVTPAGNRLLPADKARTAPSSTTRVPAHFSEPLIQRLRADKGEASGRNQLQRALPSISAANAPTWRPSAIAMRQPAAIAMRAAISLVTMPPWESAEAAAPPMASISGVISRISGMCLADLSLRGSPV